MAQNSTGGKGFIAGWHRNLLVTAATFSVLLISMGGVLCVTQSIRNCPDWPGCFGTFLPPSQPGPILEYSHRFLAAVTGLLILTAAITGITRSPRLRWVTIPPMVAVALLLEVSYFGAVVVLRGLAPGWAAVDVGSALLVVALMVTAALTASTRNHGHVSPDCLVFRTPFSRLAMAAAAVTFVVLVSGVLVAGKSSLTGCLGWPIYSLRLFQADAHTVGNIFRWTVSFAGIGLVITVLVLAWRNRQVQPTLYRLARWLGFAVLIESLVQVLLLWIGHQLPLLIVYTVTAAVFWALLVALMVCASLEEAGSQLL